MGFLNPSFAVAAKRVKGTSCNCSPVDISEWISNYWATLTALASEEIFCFQINNFFSWTFWLLKNTTEYLLLFEENNNYEVKWCWVFFSLESQSDKSNVKETDPWSCTSFSIRGTLVFQYSNEASLPDGSHLMTVPSRSKAAIFDRSLGERFEPYKHVDVRIACRFHMKEESSDTWLPELLLNIGNTDLVIPSFGNKNQPIFFRVHTYCCGLWSTDLVTFLYLGNMAWKWEVCHLFSLAVLPLECLLCRKEFVYPCFCCPLMTTLKEKDRWYKFVFFYSLAPVHLHIVALIRVSGTGHGLRLVVDTFLTTIFPMIPTSSLKHYFPRRTLVT